jgi:hypothetical protein
MKWKAHISTFAASVVEIEGVSFDAAGDQHHIQFKLEPSSNPVFDMAVFPVDEEAAQFPQSKAQYIAFLAMELLLKRMLSHVQDRLGMGIEEKSWAQPIEPDSEKVGKA